MAVAGINSPKQPGMAAAWHETALKQLESCLQGLSQQHVVTAVAGIVTLLILRVGTFGSSKTAANELR